MTHPEENLPEEWPQTVRTTFSPDQELEVGRAEYIDLQRQGLLVKNESEPETESVTTPPEDTAPPRKVAKAAPVKPEGTN